MYFIENKIQIHSVILEDKKSSITNINFVKFKQEKTPKRIVKKKIIKPKKLKSKLKSKIKTIVKKKIIKIKQNKTTINSNIKKEVKKIHKSKFIKKTNQKSIKQKENIINSYEKKENKLDNNTKKLIDLYGNKFNSFSKNTQEFLKNNIKDIGKITQNFLEYPYLSLQAQQSGISIVEFYLHVNGEISKLKIIKSSKYFLLDDNTIQTIQEAHMDYPRPKKDTLIKIFVEYEL